MNLLSRLSLKVAIFGVSSVALTYGTPLINWPNYPKVMKTIGALMGSTSAIVLVVHAEKLHEVSQLSHTYKRARLQSAKQQIVNKVVEGVLQNDPYSSVREMLENTFRLGDYTAHPEMRQPESIEHPKGEMVPATGGPIEQRSETASPEDSFAVTARRFIDYLAPRLIKLTDEDGWIEVEKLRSNWGKDNGLSSRAAMEAFLDRLAHAQIGEWHPENDSLWRMV